MKIPAYLALLVLAVAAPSCAATDTEAPMPEPITVTALINESIMPVARGGKYGRPLDVYLKELGIGEVVGGGTALGPSGGPAWVEIVVELESEASVQDAARKLQELGAPAGSHLYYYVGEQRRQVAIGDG